MMMMMMMAASPEDYNMDRKSNSLPFQIEGGAARAGLAAHPKAPLAAAIWLLHNNRLAFPVKEGRQIFLSGTLVARTRLSPP